MSEDDVIDYQNKVLDVNTEIWMDALVMNGLTFPTKYCPISIDEAKLFIKVKTRSAILIIVGFFLSLNLVNEIRL